MSVFVKECVNEKILDINKDYGILSRVFNSVPHMMKYVHCSSSFFMVYVSDTILPNRKKPYRNHYVLYKKNNTLVVALTETLLDWGPDVLPVIEYDVITVNECMKNSCGNWFLSYDKISYSCNLNVDLCEFNIVSSGEWWYFDKGRILNGINESDEFNCEFFFIYYELYPSKIDIKHKNSVTDKPKNGTFIDAIQLMLDKNDVDVEKSTTATTTAITTSPVINDQYLPLVNNIIKENSNFDRSLFQTVIPSAYWLIERATELTNNDITYFIKDSL